MARADKIHCAEYMDIDHLHAKIAWMNTRNSMYGSKTFHPFPVPNGRCHSREIKRDSLQSGISGPVYDRKSSVLGSRPGSGLVYDRKGSVIGSRPGSVCFSNRFEKIEDIYDNIDSVRSSMKLDALYEKAGIRTDSRLSTLVQPEKSVNELAVSIVPCKKKRKFVNLRWFCCGKQV